MSRERIEGILEIVKQAGVLRPRDLDPHGIPREYLRRLSEQGLLVRVARGLYMLPDAPISEHHSLAEAAKRVPNGVICLVSALRFHELTTQAPFEVWMAIENKAWRPTMSDVPLRIVRFSGRAFYADIEVHDIEGVPVRIYGPAKTVADCFKYRNKIGRDVAIEALRDCLDQRKCGADDLWTYGGICRVRSVMRPYLEALL
ncbi:MAG: transcriptional regulator [Anaerolineae bacterium CG2_30_64_16]|nr:MAG: transcriptional regulator [Anaerolineae bacterium CG2_30_64_16]